MDEIYQSSSFISFTLNEIHPSLFAKKLASATTTLVIMLFVSLDMFPKNVRKYCSQIASYSCLY